ncbi:MAG: hypothetical protein R3F61_15000 [Myxococcota bacterium]
MVDSPTVPRDSTPPERIRHLVHSDADRVVFTSVEKARILVLIGAFSGLGICVVIGIIAAILSFITALVFDDPGFIAMLPGLFMPSFMMMILGGFIGHSFSQNGRKLTVTREGMTYGGILPPEGPRVGDITLTGNPGRPIQMSSGPKVLASLNITARKRGWDYDSVTWLGRRTADLLNVGFDDRRPAEDWQRWKNDPVYRAQMRFDAGLEDNRHAFSTFHYEPPEAPPHKLDLDGMKILIESGFFSTTVLRLTPTHLVLHDRKYELSDITRAGVAYRRVKSKNSTSYYGRLQILVGTSTKTVVNLRVSSGGGTKAAQLNWLAAELMRYASTAVEQRDRGTKADIPEELARISGQATEGPESTGRSRSRATE